VSRDWDAATYDRIADPQFEWAREQLERLELRGDEVVLDAGCGSGRVTKLLLERVPRGRVYGVDVAPSMVEHARAALDGRATVLQQDLVELDLPEPVDAVFSNATFHWVHDHDALFERLFDTLKPGGQLVAQCGGFGNIDAFRNAADSVAAEEPFDHYFVGWRRPWNYATAEETSVRLSAPGSVTSPAGSSPSRSSRRSPRPLSRPSAWSGTSIRCRTAYVARLSIACSHGREPDDSGAARQSEAGCRAGRKPERSCSSMCG
jgi:trans-aconitate 2-methyltransferase